MLLHCKHILYSSHNIIVQRRHLFTKSPLHVNCVDVMKHFDDLSTIIVIILVKDKILWFTITLCDCKRRHTVSWIVHGGQTKVTLKRSSSYFNSKWLIEFVTKIANIIMSILLIKIYVSRVGYLLMKIQVCILGCVCMWIVVYAMFIWNFSRSMWNRSSTQECSSALPKNA